MTNTSLELNFTMTPNIFHNDLEICLQRLFRKSAAYKSSEESIRYFQHILNRNAYRCPEFEQYSINKDQRLYELMLSKSISNLIQKADIAKSRKVYYMLQRESPNKRSCCTDILMGEFLPISIDGLALIVDDSNQSCLLMPVEIKSTMIDPSRYPTNSIQDQGIRRIQKEANKLSRPGQVSVLFVLPFFQRDEEKKIDIMPIATKLQEILSSSSLGIISFLKLLDNKLLIHSFLVEKNAKITYDYCATHLNTVSFCIDG